MSLQEPERIYVSDKLEIVKYGNIHNLKRSLDVLFDNLDNHLKEYQKILKI
jgi:hypothetical protein